MRNLSFKIFLAGMIAAAALTSCDDWTDLSPINIPETGLDGLRDDAYYKALREWKADPDRRISFVWFDAWTGGTAGGGALSGLPDSLIIASNWGGSWPLTESQIKDMRRVQELKGTKVVITLFAAKIGEGVTPGWVATDGYDGLTGNAAHNRFWGIDDENDPATRTTDRERMRKGIQKYVKVIYDSVVKYGYDGFDWDFEPSQGSGNYLWYDSSLSLTGEAGLWGGMFLDELTYWFGPGSQRADRGDREPAIPGLLLQVDGEVGYGRFSRCPTDWAWDLVDNYILQAYGTSGKSDLDSRVGAVVSLLSYKEGFDPAEAVKRTVLTENFESYATNGGRTLTNRDKENYPDEETIPGVVYMGRYVYTANDMNVQTGGFGIYRPYFDYKQGKGDYLGSSEYWYLRHGISQLNSVYEQRKAQPGWLPNLSY